MGSGNAGKAPSEFCVVDTPAGASRFDRNSATATRSEKSMRKLNAVGRGTGRLRYQRSMMQEDLEVELHGAGGFWLCKERLMGKNLHFVHPVNIPPEEN